MEKTKDSFSISRTFDAPREVVFEAFSKAEALAKWWGPVGSPIDVIKLDFRPGGVFHYLMKGNHMSYGIFRYQEIVRPDYILFINSFANENGEIIKPPFAGMDVPREILNKISFTENNGITTLVLESRPLNASNEEIATFNSITESMEQGWGGTFDQLKSFLVMPVENTSEV